MPRSSVFEDGQDGTEMNGIIDDLVGYSFSSRGQYIPPYDNYTTMLNDGPGFFPMLNNSTVHMKRVWADPVGTVYAVGGATTATGQLGQIYLYNFPVGWSQMFQTNMALEDIDGTAPGHIWAVGFNNAIFFYNGTAWTQINHGIPGLNVNFHGVYVRGINDVFVVGDVGTILHYNGFNWVQMTPPPGWAQHFTAIDGFGGMGGQVVAVFLTDERME